jgi:putative ABC transport system permease protein
LCNRFPVNVLGVPIGLERSLSIRTLWQAPAFLLVVALILGLGIGATTALYSAVDAVLLRPG